MLWVHVDGFPKSSSHECVNLTGTVHTFSPVIYDCYQLSFITISLSYTMVRAHVRCDNARA